MTDYRTLLRHAGLSDEEVERIASEAEALDAKEQANESVDSWYDGVTKLIRLIGRKTGVEPEGAHDIYIEDNRCEIRLVHGQQYPLSQLMDFANKIASEGVGHDIKVGADADQRIVVEFSLIGG